MTLVELLISVTLLSLIIGGIATAFVTALNGTRPASQRINESNDAQIIAGFLTRDAQAAGGSNVSTGTPDPALGVSTTDNAGCTGTGTLKLRFKWLDRVTGSSTHSRVVNYYYVAGSDQLNRTTCTDGGTASTLTLAGQVASVSTDCTPGGATCSVSFPDKVSLHVTETNNPVNAQSPYSFTLTASLRPEPQIAPTDANASTVSLLLLGGNGGCSSSVPPLDATGGSGASQINVYGTAYVNGGNSSCVAADLNGNYTASGGTAVVAGTHCASSLTCTTYANPFTDPYAGLPTPSGNCSSGTHPAPSGNTMFPGVYQTDPSSPSNPVLSPGVYIFCHGFSPNNANVTTPGVLLYFAGLCSASQPQPCVSSNLGTFNGGGTNYFQPATTGNYANLVMWQAISNNVSPTFGTSNGSATNLDGTVYVPGAILTIKKSTQMKAVVAQAIRWGSGGGNGTTIIGTATPVTVSGTPATLPNGTKGQAYTPTTVTATGGGGTYTWTATGLPANMSIGATTGVIAGTPNASGNFTIKVTATDVFGNQGSRTFPAITINPALALSGSLPPWTQNKPGYPSNPLTASGGSGGYTWSATGLPAGLSMNASGTISGTPTTAATYTPQVTISDSSGDTLTQGYSVTITAPPTITGVSLFNKSTNPVGTAGTIEKGDTIVVFFSSQMSVSSFCSSWSNDATDQSLSVNGNFVNVIDGTGATNDSITLTAPAANCTGGFHFDSIDLGSSGYVSGGNAAFGGNGGSNRSTFAWNHTARTLTITLGTKGATGTMANVQSSTPKYTASTLITDSIGATIANSPFTLQNAKQF